MSDIDFRYEGEPGYKDPDKCFCVYTYEGKEYRVRYRTILEMAYILHTLPKPIRASIEFWCDMLHNPD